MKCFTSWAVFFIWDNLLHQTTDVANFVNKDEIIILMVTYTNYLYGFTGKAEDSYVIVVFTKDISWFMILWFKMKI